MESAVPDKQTENMLSECCDKIYEIRVNDKNADISEVEQFIDDIVYNAYALTGDEILIVKNTIEEWENSQK